MNIDEFSSQFKSALKVPYQLEELNLRSIMLVSDREARLTEPYLETVKGLVGADIAKFWEVLGGDQYDSTRSLLEQVENGKPDLIITRRNLKTRDENLVYGLSDYIDALTQVCSCPVLLLPDIRLEEMPTALPRIKNVLVETNHLTGDSRLINWALAFAKPNGSLVLAHIEDDRTYKRYLDVISKIPELDTDIAEERIRETLLKLPRDFIEQVSSLLEKRHKQLRVHGIAKLGHGIEDYSALLNEHLIDLVVINTKVDGQLAMDGIAYAIAVEFKQLPLLLL